MICPKCNIEMVPSTAIKPKHNEQNVRYIMANDPVLKPDEVFLIDCLKCPACGYSSSTQEQIDNGVQVFTSTQVLMSTRTKNRPYVEDLFNRNGEYEEAVKSWKDATPDELAMKKFLDDCVREELDKELLEKILTIYHETESKT